MGSFTEGDAKKTVEVKFGKTGFARGMFEENTGLVLGGEKVTAATESAKSVVME